MRVLVTGGAGFVGARIARDFRARGAEVVALDNLRRRGSETNLAPLRADGVAFVHGDVRAPADLEDLEGTFDVVVDAAAEPSVLAGLGGSPRYVIETNLLGTVNLLEFCRRRAGALLFLSTSRVYSIDPLRRLALTETPTRFELAAEQPVAGAGPAGVSEGFPTDTSRSFYGATKLASRAAGAGVRRPSTACGRSSPLRRHHRPRAVRQGRTRASSRCGPPTTASAAAALHRLRRRAASRCATCSTSTTWSRSCELQLDGIERCSGRGLQRRRRARAARCRCRELTALCREASGREVEIGSDEPRPRRSTSRSTSPTTHGSTRRARLASHHRPPRDASARSSTGCAPTRGALRAGCSPPRKGDGLSVGRDRHRIGGPDRQRDGRASCTSRASTSSASTTTCAATSSARRPRPRWNTERLASRLPRFHPHRARHPRHRGRSTRLFAAYGSADRAGRPHRGPAQPRLGRHASRTPTSRVNAIGTLNLLEATRAALPRGDRSSSRRPTRSTATRPNDLPLGRDRDAAGARPGAPASRARHRRDDVDRPLARTRLFGASQGWPPTCWCRSTGATSACRPAASAAAA